MQSVQKMDGVIICEAGTCCIALWNLSILPRSWRVEKALDSLDDGNALGGILRDEDDSDIYIFASKFSSYDGLSSCPISVYH